MDFEEGKIAPSAQVRFGSILKHPGYSQTIGRSQSNQVKGRGDRKDLLETKSTEQSPATKRIIQFARRKDLHAKANQEAQELLFLFCLPKLSLLYLDMYFCPHKIHGKSRQIHYQAEANTWLCDFYRNAQ